jgi:hypothetical protein
MRHALRRFFLFGFIFGAFATVAPAQRVSAHVPPPQAAIGSHYPWSPGEYSYQPQYTPSGHDRRRLSGSAPAEHHVSYAQGDANFVPSVYMDYHQALTLGKPPLQEQAKPQPEPSLGEMARVLRGNSDATDSSNTLAFSAIQGNKGQLVICRNTCRPVS